MKKEVGYRIRKIRESKDLSQQNMADELGITGGAYSKIERGETDPSIGRLKEIAEILRVPLLEIVEGTSNIMKETPVPLGFASKQDMEQLTLIVEKLQREISTLKKEIEAVKPKAKPKRKA